MDWELVTEAENMIALFTNERRERILKITKQVTGNLGDVSHPFRFALYLESFIKSRQVLNWKINDVECLAEYDEEEGCYRFELASEDVLEVLLPVNTSFRVTEDNEDYQTHIISENSNDSMEREGNDFSGILQEDQLLTFINDRRMAVPTGVDVDNDPALMICVPLAIIFILMITRRKIS